MSNNPVEDLTYDPSDEHIMTLVGKSIKCCQNSMIVEIENRHKIALGEVEKLKASLAAEHARLDNQGKEIEGLVQPETGKVTILWSDRKEFVRWFKVTVGGMFLLMLISQFTNFYSTRDLSKKMDIEQARRILQEETKNK